MPLPRECPDCCERTTALATLADFAGTLCDSCLHQLATLRRPRIREQDADQLTMGTALAGIRTAAIAELERRERRERV